MRNLKKLIVKKPEDLWEKLALVEREAVVSRPPGAFTTKEYSQKRNVTIAVAKTSLERLVRLGKVRKISVPSSRQILWFLA